MENNGKSQGEFTQLMYHLATSDSLTLAQAAEQLKENAHVRSLRETLAKACGISENDLKALRTFLVEKLLENSPPNTVRDSVERKVRMWLKDEVQTISKQSAIQLSFILGMSADDAGQFLYRACGEGFHWRDPGEIVLLYALSEGMNYQEALILHDTIEKKGLLSIQKREGTETLTDVVRTEAEKIRNTSELEDYLREAGPQLGVLHNTAYGLFREYLDLLINPEMNDDLGPEVKISVREITDTYLHQKFIPRIKKGSKKNPKAEDLVLSALQRDIQQSWPDETTLSKMLNRKTDVTRKVLILLFLATDGDTKASIQEQDFAFLTEEDELLPEDEEAGFEDLQFRLNAMLSDCGFAPLDSRTPFDWMVLYCMCADESMLIDQRVQQFLTEIFPASVPSGDA